PETAPHRAGHLYFAASVPASTTASPVSGTPVVRLVQVVHSPTTATVRPRTDQIGSTRGLTRRYPGAMRAFFPYFI
ncbi:MAG: hypothetical protein ACTHXO_12260, partial [Actinomycetaceae bacterium]